MISQSLGKSKRGRLPSLELEVMATELSEHSQKTLQKQAPVSPDMTNISRIFSIENGRTSRC